MDCTTYGESLSFNFSFIRLEDRALIVDASFFLGAA
jgi:hypothetical protein